MNSYTCFVISPIGDPGSEVRNMADDVLDYLIIPALRNCGFMPENIYEQINYIVPEALIKILFLW